MTDPPFEYSQLPLHVGYLKKAAIDAFMKSRGYRLHRDTYDLSGPGEMISVTKPDTNGQGGGTVTINCFDAATGAISSTTTDDSGVATFDGIRASIDAMLHGLDAIPDGSRLLGLSKTLQPLAGRLSTEFTQSLPGMMPASDVSLDTDINHIQLDMQQYGWSGQYLEPFRHRVESLSAICGNMCRIVLFLDAIVQGEIGLFSRARDDVCQIVADVTSKYQAYAGQPEPDFSWRNVFEAASAFFTVVSLARGISAIADGVGVGFDLLAKLMVTGEPTPAPQPVPDYAATTDALATSLANLATVTRTEDSAATDAMYDLATFIENASAGFFTWPPYSGDSADIPQVVVPPTEEEGRATVDNLRDIERILAEIAESLINDPDPSAWTRPYPVGLFPSGPHAGWEAAQLALAKRIGSFSKDVRTTCSVLKQIIQDFTEADREAQRQMERIQEALDAAHNDPRDPKNHIRVPGHGSY